MNKLARKALNKKVREIGPYFLEKAIREDVTREDLTSKKSIAYEILNSWKSKYNSKHYRKYVYDRLESFFEDIFDDKNDRLFRSFVNSFNKNPSKYKLSGTSNFDLPYDEGDAIAEEVQPARRWVDFIDVMLEAIKTGLASRDTRIIFDVMSSGVSDYKIVYASVTDLDNDRPKLNSITSAMDSNSYASLFYDQIQNEFVIVADDINP